MALSVLKVVSRWLALGIGLPISPRRSNLLCEPLEDRCVPAATAAIEQGLLDRIDQLAPTYYRSSWNMSLEQFKAWTATIAWAEGANGGYTAHSQAKFDPKTGYGDLYYHRDLGNAFTFSTGLGPFQLDRVSQANPELPDNWSYWPTIKKLDPNFSVESVLRVHRDLFPSGATLNDFASQSPWIGVKLSNPALPGKWQDVTDTQWSANVSGAQTLDWNAIVDQLALNAVQLGRGHDFGKNVVDMGIRRWTIDASDAVKTDTGKDVLFNGDFQTWMINARSWSGTKLFSYYYTFKPGVEIWVHNDPATSYRYAFVREYATGPLPEGASGSHAGVTLLSSGIDLFNVATAAPISDFAWRYKQSMPQALAGSVGAALNGQFHLIGGDSMRAHHVYDPKTDHWTTAAPVPAPGITDGGAVVVGSKLYAVGHNTYDDQIRIYDPATDSWTLGDWMITSRDYPAVAAARDRIYAIGGFDPSNNRGSSLVEEYDPVTNSWRRRTSMPTARGGAVAVSVGALIYVFGGSGAGTIQRAVEVYDPFKDEWTARPDMPFNRVFAAGASVAGKIYLFGGIDGGSHAVASVEEYDPIKGIWRTLPSGLLAPGYGAVAAVVDGKPYVAGGWIDVGGGGTTVSSRVQQGTVRNVPTVVVSAAQGGIQSNNLAFQRQRASITANSVTGSSELFVTATEELPYTIKFGSQATATLPAQQAVVTDRLDPNLDWTTFKVGDFGIGLATYSVPASGGSFSTRLDLTDSVGIYLDVVAGIDLATGIATWTFASIDPATGGLPASVTVGFLPPDTQAYVTYRIRPKNTVETGDRIDAEAAIMLDGARPVGTPQITNFVDAGAPTSEVVALPASIGPRTFSVSWAGSDDAGGSGIAAYDLYVSDNGSEFRPFLQGTMDTSTAFTGEYGHWYAFYTIAIDNAGNRQSQLGAVRSILIRKQPVKVALRQHSSRKLMAQVTFMDQTKRRILSPFPPPTFSKIKVALYDADHDGLPDSIRFTARWRTRKTSRVVKL